MAKKNFLNALFIKQIIKILPLLSKKNLVNLLKLYEGLASGKTKEIVVAVKKALETTLAGDMIIRGLKLVNPRCREKIATTLVAEGFIARDKKRIEAAEKGSAVPLTVLISPTMRCNLRCKGCYAYNYSRKDDLPYEVLSRVVTEAEELGTAFVTILGGEPLVMEDLFKLYAEHQNMYFQFYSNGTLMTKEVTSKLAKLGNVAVIFSIEGFEKETDDRRGEGVYEKVLKAMDITKKAGVPFGYSVVVTSSNEPVISSDEFVDLMLSKGALLGWYFLYMPVGKDPDLSLMPTPEQRLHLFESDKRIRATKQMFIIDFWNDAPLVGGCIAGKGYVHITSSGDVEPCIFTHLAQDNIKDKSLKEVMDSEYFKKLRSKQPYDENLYLPCQWIDHPEVSRGLYKELKLKITHPGADDVLVREDLKAGLDKYSAKVQKLYAKEWEKFSKS